MSGKYNAETTGEEIMADFGTFAKDKHIIVTGANVGLGFETSRLLAKDGAIVTIACRSVADGTNTVKKIKDEFPDSRVSFLHPLDLGSFASVRAFASAYKAAGNPLHVLINNAGVMACPKTLTSDGLEMQFGVNHIGHYLLTKELLDVLKSSGTAASPSRVINLSSRGHFMFAPQDVGIRFDDLQGNALCQLLSFSVHHNMCFQVMYPTNYGKDMGLPSWPMCCSRRSCREGSPRRAAM